MCPTDGELPRHKGEHGTCGRSPGTQGTASHLWITIDHMLDPEVNDWLTTAFCIQWFSFHLDAAVVQVSKPVRNSRHLVSTGERPRVGEGIIGCLSITLATIGTAVNSRLSARNRSIVSVST
jgi:hypothetical protein